MLRIGLLGGLRLDGDDRVLAPPDSRPGRVLLAWLALHPGAHGRSRLAGVLRPDATEEAARQTLRQALWAIRRSLGDHAGEVLMATREEAGLRAEAISVEAAALLASATLLPDLDDEWVLDARERLRSDLATACARRVDSLAAAEALTWARVRAQLEPLSETAGRDVIRLLAETGDRAAAVEAAGRLRERLDDELGVPPSAETRALIEDVLRGDESAAPREPVRRPPAVAAQPALPSVLAALREQPLAGRAAVLEGLGSAWTRARDGSPTV